MLLNNVLVAAFIAWFVAQTLKVVLTFVSNREIDFRRFVGAGGMPSSHTALVMALTTGVGRKLGWDSTEFAIALVFSLVVMYDAAGVRRAVGNQAEVLNKLLDEIFHKGEFREERLKELLGHTPKEVFAGAVLGIVIAWLFVP